MKIFKSIINLLLSAVLLKDVKGQREYRYQKTPLEVKIGECLNLTAISYFSSISTLSTDLEISWQKDTHLIPFNKASLYISYVTLKDAAYYEVMVYNKTWNIKESTDIWVTVTECKSNEKESKEKAVNCKTSCVEMCQSGWHFSESSAGNKCYKYFSDMKTWSAAHDSCQAISGQLARVENSAENIFVGNLLKTAEGGWIGLNDRSSESTFTWNSAKSNKVSFWSWAESEPSNSNSECNIENCVIINKNFAEWSDVICNAFYPFVCEKSTTNHSDWSCYGSKCYRYVHNLMIWQDALKFCQSLGSKLASISSSFENNAVAKVMERDSWIGLNDIAEAGNFVWNKIGYSAQKLTYTNWAKNEPNDMIFSNTYTTGCPGEDCVVIRSWQSQILWYDVKCDAKNPYICEKMEDSLLTTGQIVGIVIGSLIGVAVIAGIANAKMRNRRRAKVKAIILSAYERDYSEREQNDVMPKTFKNYIPNMKHAKSS